MITAHSSDVNMPPGHYDKIAQVIRSLIGRGHTRYAKGKRRPPKRARPTVPTKLEKEIHHWKIIRAWVDPEELLELWAR